ncbi:hypothetical protein SAMN05660297_01334 [Natronincola peptidivorans]|uniref:Uncharacterized protein n=1 Tax=Natronincola peptidivorans TaxID=426128 RepID=A0A1I0BM54_9FIRM|nr:AEC family transporter [Natronincola peptidivorans]SET08032.1 hypothetical protein SAMN05660297_01334 [Natronincola peptidivorans]
MIAADGLHSALSILFIILIGYALTHIGMFNQEVSRLFSKIVINVSLPALVYSNLIKTYSKDMLMESGLGLAISIITMILSFMIGMLVGKLLKIKTERIGLFASMFAMGNTLFIGLPVNISVFGQQSLPYVLLFYMGNTIMFWTVIVYSIRQDKEKGIRKLLGWDNVKRIFSPPLIAYFIGMSVILLNISTPKFVFDTFSYIGQLTTPLSLLFIGIVIYSVNLKDIEFDLSVAAIMIGRYIVSPLLVYIFVKDLSIPLLMKRVFIMEAAMPVMTLIAIVAQAYDADYKYATVIASISTLISLIVIPIYSVILS